MTEYSFDTINQTQADLFGSTDTLLFPTGTASAVVVTASASTPTTIGKISLTLGSKTLIFDAADFNANGDIVFTDGSILVIDNGANPGATAGSTLADQIYGGLGNTADGLDVIEG